MTEARDGVASTDGPFDRVLVLCGDPGVPVYGPSGASVHLRAISAAWRRRGAEVRVAALRETDDRGRWGEPLNAEVVSAPGTRLVRSWPRRVSGWGCWFPEDECQNSLLLFVKLQHLREIT